MNDEKTLKLLAGGLLVYTALIVLVSWLLPGNEKLYTLLAGILGNFSGGLMVYIRMQQPPPPPPPVAGHDLAV